MIQGGLWRWLVGMLDCTAILASVGGFGCSRGSGLLLGVYA